MVQQGNKRREMKALMSCENDVGIFTGKVQKGTLAKCISTILCIQRLRPCLSFIKFIHGWSFSIHGLQCLFSSASSVIFISTFHPWIISTDENFIHRYFPWMILLSMDKTFSSMDDCDWWKYPWIKSCHLSMDHNLYFSCFGLKIIKSIIPRAICIRTLT